MNDVLSLVDRIKTLGADKVALDRTFPSAYPEYLERVIYPEEDTRVKDFDPKTLECWSHEDWLKGRISGEIVFAYLQFNDLFDDCLSFAELGGIYNKGLSFFREHFNGKAVFAWRAMLAFPRDRRVPYLIESFGMLALCFYPIKSLWKENFIAPRFVDGRRVVDTSHFGKVVRIECR